VKLTRPDLTTLAVLAVVVVGIVACSLARVDVPDVLPTLALILSGAGAGLSFAKPTAAAAPTVAPYNAGSAEPSPRPLIPGALYDDPPTGTFSAIR
jgi:hypothetical protein